MNAAAGGDLFAAPDDDAGRRGIDPVLLEQRIILGKEGSEVGPLIENPLCLKQLLFVTCEGLAANFIIMLPEEAFLVFINQI